MGKRKLSEANRPIPTTPVASKIKKQRRPPVKIQRKKAQPVKKEIKQEVIEEEPVVPVETPILEPISVEDAKNLFYPFENLDDFPDLEKVVVAYKKSGGTVLDEHVTRATIPKEKMLSAAKMLKRKFMHARIERYAGNIPALDGTANEVFSEFTEDDINIDKSIFRQELVKYNAVASKHLDKLSPDTLWKIVQDVERTHANMFMFERGAPVKVASSPRKHFGLTEYQFEKLHEHHKIDHKKKHLEEVLKYHKKMDEYLNSNYKAVRAQAEELKKGFKWNKISSVDPWKHWPEGKEKEAELIRAANANRDMLRYKQIEYNRIDTLEETTVKPARDAYRLAFIRGEIGARTRKQEDVLERSFLATPLKTLNKFYAEPARKREEERKREETERKKAVEEAIEEMLKRVVDEIDGVEEAEIGKNIEGLKLVKEEEETDNENDENDPPVRERDEMEGGLRSLNPFFHHAFDPL